MIDVNIEERVIHLNNSRERNKIEEFLKGQELELDRDVEYTIALFEGDKIVGTGSLSGKVLKCIAVDPEYKGLGLSNRIISLLLSEEYERGNTHLFLFTKPENYSMFKDMGFYRIMEASSKVILLENDPTGIYKYVNDLKTKRIEGKSISSIVMNCNPFTLGHKYLIEYAAKESDILHIFVVWEDKSTFPRDVRYKLIKEGTKDLSNIVIHRGKDYIISNSTFPSYFIKEGNEQVKAHAFLDLKIFGEYIAPALGINKRFIGEEPYCHVTKKYNEAMKELLPDFGINVIEIPRLSIKGTKVSASRVRELIKTEEFSEIKRIVPKTTYDYLISEDGKDVINKIKVGVSRH